ncbi:hypothetical protein BH10PSE7_BH10PSE7_05880 [soil metagenome]
MRMLPAAAPAGERGFTIIEVLAGLLVSTIILIGLTTATRLIAANWQRATIAAVRQDMFDRAIDVISEDVSHIERVTAPGERSSEFMFSGDPAEMTYVILERPFPTVSRPYFLKLFVTEGAGGQALVRSRAHYEPAIANMETLAWADETTLIEGPYSIRFSYRTSRNAETGWSPAWDATGELPDQVRLEVRRAADGELLLPPAIFATRITAEAGCGSPETQGCTIASNGILRESP